MRVLALTQKLPAPAHDGYNLRTAAYLPRLAGRHEVRLVSLANGACPPELARRLERVVTVPERAPVRLRGLARVAAACSPDELYDRDPAVDAALAREASAFRPDVIWSVGWRMLPYALDVGVPVLADVVDEAVREAWLAWKAAPAPRRLAHLVRVLRFERRHFPRAARVLFVSEQDAEVTTRVAPGARCEVLPNGVDTAYFHPDLAPEYPDLLVFEGALSHVPNADAVRFFVRDVLPRVRAERPSARFVAVGRDPAPELLALAGDDPAASGVAFTGFVDDVRPHVARAALFVSPLVGGAGLKNKVLQAWALGKAVVATPLSVGGLGAVDGEELVVAEGEAAFAHACVRLLGDPAARARLGAAGRRAAVERFSWDRAAERLEALLADVARERSR